MMSDQAKKDNIDCLQKSMERWYLLAFRQCCDVVTEVNLETGDYIQNAITKEMLLPISLENDYEAMYQFLIENKICKEDVERIQEIFPIKTLLESYKQRKKEEVCQYRVKRTCGGIIWIESRIFYLYDETFPCAVITSYDVTKQKKQELQQRISDKYDIALRNIYDELYELNITQNTYCIIYHVEDKYVIPSENGILKNTIIEISTNMIHPEDKQRFLEFFDLDNVKRLFASGKDSLIGEFRKLWSDGKFHWASLTLFPLERTQNEDEIFLCFIMDIEDKKLADEIAEQNRLLQRQQMDDERYRIIVEQTGTIVFEWIREENYRYVSPIMSETFEGTYNDRDLYTIWKCDHVVHDDDLPKMKDFFSNTVGKNDYSEITIRLLTRKKDFVWCKVAITHIFDEDGKVKRIIGTLNNVDDAMRSRQVLSYQAEYDTLTGIFNVQGFYSLAQLLLKTNANEKYAVIRMDVNRFKFINDIYGIEEGDKLLQFIASTIKDNTTSKDAVGRINSDIFSLCVAFQSEVDLVSLVERITDIIGQYSLGYTVVPSFGICVIDDRSVPISILCDWANLALKTVKGNLIRKWAFYDDKLRAKQLDERNIEDEMEKALELYQFTVYLQPKHDIKSYRIIGAEALVRWNHPKEGVLSPYRFIPLFERNGFIIRLDEFVWEETCKILRRWIDKGHVPVPISVNVSRIHIYNPGFEDKIIKLLEKYQLPSSLVELELTESTFVENPEELYKTMKVLQDKGFNFSMDDFGSGYSSLNMLKNAPINTIKLDREFLNETSATQKGKTIIQHTIAMAKQLDLQVIAEGVETEKQAQFLMQAGCITAQGFYFSRPMPLDQFEKMTF